MESMIPPRQGSFRQSRSPVQQAPLDRPPLAFCKRRLSWPEINSSATSGWVIFIKLLSAMKKRWTRNRGKVLMKLLRHQIKSHLMHRNYVLSPVCHHHVNSHCLRSSLKSHYKRINVRRFAGKTKNFYTEFNSPYARRKKPTNDETSHPHCGQSFWWWHCLI